MASSEATRASKLVGGYDPSEDPWAVHLKDATPNQILLSLSPYEAFFGEKSWHKPQIEPPPQIDYRAVHLMLVLCRSSLTKHVLKRWDYLVEARKQYFWIHHKFHVEFHGLQDARAYDEMIVKRTGDLKEQFEDWEKQGVTGPGMERKKQEFDDLMASIERNRAKMSELINTVTDLAKRRDQAAAWFSNMKSEIVKSDLRALVYLTGKLYESAKAKSAENGEPQSSSLQLQAYADPRQAAMGGSHDAGEYLNHLQMPPNYFRYVC